MKGGCDLIYYSHGANRGNKPFVILEAAEGSEFALRQIVAELSKSHNPVRADFSDIKRKRSLNVNAYMWVLLDKLAQKLQADREELYRRYIRHYGEFEDVMVRTERRDDFITKWACNGSSKASGWFAEVVNNNSRWAEVRAYLGSSAYDSKQMSRLVNAIVADCADQGIDTMTPAEIAALCDRWKP